MKAVVLPAYGPPSVLEVRDVPEPSPGAGQVKVRVAATSVNPIDWKLRSGAAQKLMPLKAKTGKGDAIAKVREQREEAR